MPQERDNSYCYNGTSHRCVQDVIMVKCRPFIGYTPCYANASTGEVHTRNIVTGLVDKRKGIDQRFVSKPTNPKRFAKTVVIMSCFRKHFRRS